MYNIGNSQLGGIPPSNYLYTTSQILTQTSPYYYINHQNQGGFHSGYSRDYQMGFQGVGQNPIMGLNSLNFIPQSQGQQQQQQQVSSHNQQHHNQQQYQHQQGNRNSEQHEKENHSKERSVKRNNSNAVRDRSTEKNSFNKSTPHFFPSAENQNNNTSGGNYQSSNNSGNVIMTSSNGNNNMGSQTNLKENDKINQIQKIYNNNIRSRNNFHKSQNNFYNTHSNAFFNSNSSNTNNNNGSLDQRKKNGLSSRISQSPSTDMKAGTHQPNAGQLNRKYYASQQNSKLNSQISSNPTSYNQNHPVLFQKENNNIANIYSKDNKQGRNSITGVKPIEKKDTLNQIYKPQTKGSINLGSATTKNTNLAYQAPSFVNQNTQSNKFYQTEPNFNKKSSKKSFQIAKSMLKTQLKPIEDLIMNENLTSQNQIGRKYFANTSTNQNLNPLSSQQNRLQFTPKQQLSSSNTFSKQKKKEEIIPIQRKSKTFEDRKVNGQGRQSLLENQDYDMEYDESFEQSQQTSKNPEQIYNYDIEIDQPITKALQKQKVLTQVDEENHPQKNSLPTNEDSPQDYQNNSLDHINEQPIEKNKTSTKYPQKDKSTKDEQKNNERKDDDKVPYQKYPSYYPQQSNYIESRKSNNNFELEVIQEQNKEDEVKEVPADLLQQVQKISEFRPKTSEGGRRRRKLKQLQQQGQENTKNKDEQEETIVVEKELKNKDKLNNMGKVTQNKNDHLSIENNKMYDLIENSPKQLDFSPLKAQFDNNDKEEYSNNEYDEDFEECESEQRGDKRYKHQFFRSQAEFYRSSFTESEQNYNAATHYGSFKNQDGQKKNRLSFRRTINEGFDTKYQSCDQDSEQQQQYQPKMYNLFKRNSQNLNSDVSYQQNLPSHRIAPNGDIPLEVHVQEDDSEYVYQETSQRKKVFLKKKTIDTSDGHKIIIRHNKSAAGPKRIPKQQQGNGDSNTNQEYISSQQQQEQLEQQQKNKQNENQPKEHQDDVVERVVVSFKTGLDNEFINLFAQSQQF